MSKLTLLLAPFMSLVLVCAQALWGTAIKNDKPLSHPFPEVVTALLSNSKIWAGAVLYGVGVIVYFVLLSRFKFFSVQIGLTGLSIIFSTCLSALLFHERLSGINLVGMVLVLCGVGFVFA